MIDKLDSYGQLTYRGAWALEIIAASMGLLTALLLGSQAYQESDSAIPLDAILMAIPFVMVAFAEKIQSMNQLPFLHRNAMFYCHIYS